MRRTILASVVSFSLVLGAVLGVSAYLQAQGQYPGATLVQPGPALHALTPISATAAVNNAVTLTIPAPPAGFYNYICKLQYVISQDGTATAANNVVTTSTNFNSFAFAASSEDVAQKEAIRSVDFGSPATGCAKSTAPGTATTFVSPTAITNAAFWWGAAYYQAP